MKGFYDNCKLVGRSICIGECADVQMVRGGYIKDRVLGFPLDRDKANAECDRCEFNQLKQKGCRA